VARLTAIWNWFVNPGVGKFWGRALLALIVAAGAGVGFLILGSFLVFYLFGLCGGDAYPTTCWSDPWYAYIPFAVGLLILANLAFWTVMGVLYGLIMVVYAVRHLVRRMQAPTQPSTQH
jgi:hypothetical protein